MREEPMEPEDREIREIAEILEKVADQRAHRWSPYVSVALRIAGISLSVLLAVLFSNRHYQNDVVEAASSIPGQFDLLIIAAGLILIPIFLFIDIRRIIRLIRADGKLTPAAILSNWFYIMSRPMVTYLFWTAIFYTWPSVNSYGFRWIVVGFIIGSNLRMTFYDRRPKLHNSTQLR